MFVLSGRDLSGNDVSGLEKNSFEGLTMLTKL